MTTEEREAAILSLERLVLVQAKRLLRTLPKGIHLNDLVSAGWLGAIQAVDRYDARKGTLGSFAALRIQGAMVDYLRSLDPLSRDHRRALKLADAAAPITFSLDRPMDKRDPDSDVISIADARSRDDVHHFETRHELDRIFRRAHLKPQLKRVLDKYYRGGLTLKQIGKTEGVGECRAHQLRHEALETLRLAA